MSPVPLPAAPATPGLTPPSSRGRSSQQIGDIVVGFGYAGRESVELAITEARAGGRRTGEVLVDRGVLTPDQLARVIAERFGVDHVDLNAFRVDMSAANLLPAAAAKRYSAVPVGFLEGRTLLVAMVDPGNVLAIDDISLMTGHDVRPAVAAQEDVGALIGRMNQIDDMVVEEAVIDEGPEVVDLRESADDAPVVKLSTRSSRRASTRAPPTSTSSRSPASCSSASASTACWPRRRASRAASSRASSRASRSCRSSTSPSAASRRTAAPR
jgi:type IV pilus assembly protein PilB